VPLTRARRAGAHTCAPRAATLARRSRAHARRRCRVSSLIGPACCLRRSPVCAGAGAHLCSLEPSRSHTGAESSPAGAVVCSHAAAAHSPITAARPPALTLHCRMLARGHRSHTRPQPRRVLAWARRTCCGRPPEQLRLPTHAMGSHEPARRRARLSPVHEPAGQPELVLVCFVEVTRESTRRT
jgi:hypothetical protein